MTIIIHNTEASRIAYEVSKLNVKEVHEFVDVLKNLQDIANQTRRGKHNFSAVKQRIAFNEYKENEDETN